MALLCGSRRKRPPRVAVVASSVRPWGLEAGELLGILLRDRLYERMEISGLTGITAAQRPSLIALGAIERPAGPA